MLTTFVGRFTSRTSEVSLDGRVLAFTVVVAVLTGLAQSLLAQNKVKDAIETAELAFKADAKAPEAKYTLGLVLLQVTIGFSITDVPFLGLIHGANAAAIVAAAVIAALRVRRASRSRAGTEAATSEEATSDAVSA